MGISLKAARINKGLRQIDVANALGVRKETVSSWENGKSMPRVEMIDALCELLGMKYDDIRWKV